MTIKSSSDNSRGGANDSPTGAFKAAAQESWRTLPYVDENSQDAWDVFQETLVPLSEIKTDKAGRDGSPMDVEDDKNEQGERAGPALHDTIVTDLNKVPKLRTHLRAYHVNHKIARSYEDHYKTTHYYQEELERLRARAIRRGDFVDSEAKEEDQQEPEPEPEVTRRGRPKGRGTSSAAASGSRRGGRGGGRVQA